MSSWPALRSTLDAVAARGEEIRFWWRDDDAGRADPALDRVLDLARRQGAPLALAVVARWLEEDAQDAIAANDRVTVLQHGWAHDNAAPEGAKPVELGHRAVETLLEELVRGRAMLEEAFGTLFMAVLVPPWNRIDPALVGRLGEAGYVGLSTFGRRRAAAATNGLAQVNTHLDPVDWRGSRLFIGTGAALERLTLAIDGAEEPIGVLTHHLVMDEAGWTFVERLLEELGRHPGARLCDARELFGGPGVMDPLLEVEDLKVQFLADEGVVEAVRGVSFTVPPGKTVALVGESGSGKSVISQAILGILPQIGEITQGRILFRDPKLASDPVDLARYPDDHPLRRRVRGGRISIIFQEPMSSLSPLHTIGDQISEALLLHSDEGREDGRGRTVEMLRRVGFPNPDQAFRTYPFELSGGLRQRAMIAMALVCQPALLIADEPTTALDVTIQAQILKLMHDLQVEFRMAILFITHDLGVVANMADEVVVLYRGQVMESGSCEALLSRPQHPYLKALLHAVPRLAMEPGERLTPLREVKTAGRAALIGRDEGAIRGEAASGPLLEVAGLRKVFRTRKGGWFGSGGRAVLAVDDVGFTVARGESFGLVGESGCGKTTVSKMVMRAVTPDQGRITFHDPAGPIDVLALEGHALERFRKRLQYMFQDPFHSLNPRMTVNDIVAEPMVIHRVGDDQSRLERVKALLAAVGLDVRHLRRYPHSFSGGQRQRIGIARALALGPEMLICDEPVSALDVSVQAQILNLLKDLQDELGLTYLFISHNLAVVRYICQRIAVMCAGRIVEIAPSETLFANPVHPYTKALLAAVPEPDLTKPLDFTALMAGKTSEPDAWPAPFTIRDESTHLADLGGHHHVRMSREADVQAVLHAA